MATKWTVVASPNGHGDHSSQLMSVSCSSAKSCFAAGSWDHGYGATLGLRPSCEEEVVAQLVELRRHATDYARRDGRVAADAFFAAEQNARVVRSAEHYYRTMVHGGQKRQLPLPKRSRNACRALLPMPWLSRTSSVFRRGNPGDAARLPRSAR